MYGKISLRHEKLKSSCRYFEFHAYANIDVGSENTKEIYLQVKIPFLLRACITENLLQQASCSQIDAFASL